jgi:hypothetical protein
MASSTIFDRISSAAILSSALSYGVGLTVFSTSSRRLQKELGEVFVDGTLPGQSTLLQEKPVYREASQIDFGELL